MFVFLFEEWMKKKDAASNRCKSIKKRLLFLCKLHSHCSLTVSLASLKAMARSIEA